MRIRSPSTGTTAQLSTKVDAGLRDEGHLHSNGDGDRPLRPETATITVTIKVTDDDEAPEITVGGLAISGTTRVDYAEDRRDAVATYVASGPESANARWSLEGDDAGDFRISSCGCAHLREGA